MKTALMWLFGSSLFIASAGLKMVDELASLHLTTFAVSIETSAQPGGSTPEQETRIRQEVARTFDCRRSVARSGVTALLFALQSRTATFGAVRSDDLLMKETKTAIDAALVCNPLDGNLWFLSGWFSRLGGGETPLFQRMLAMSISTMPFEGEVLQKRWTLMAAVLPDLPIADQALLASDLANMLMYTDAKAAASVIVSLRDAGSWQLAQAALSFVPDARLDVLTALVTPAQVPTIGSDKFKQFEFTPVGPVRREP